MEIRVSMTAFFMVFCRIKYTALHKNYKELTGL